MYNRSRSGLDGVWTESIHLILAAVMMIVIFSNQRTPFLVGASILASVLFLGISTFQVIFEWASARDTVAYLLSLSFGALVIALGISYFTDQTQFTGIVTERRWHYSWEVERWMAVGDRCWSTGCEPANAYDTRRQWEDTGRDRKVGESCTTSTKTDSNGRKYEDEDCTPIYEDIYDWRIYYTENRWQYIRTEMAQGVNSQPFWPELNITRLFQSPMCSSGVIATAVVKNSEMLGCERPGQQHPTHFYSLRAQKPLMISSECSVDLATWNALKIEQSLTGKYWTHQVTIDCSNIVFTGG